MYNETDILRIIDQSFPEFAKIRESHEAERGGHIGVCLDLGDLSSVFVELIKKNNQPEAARIAIAIEDLYCNGDGIVKNHVGVCFLEDVAAAVFGRSVSRGMVLTALGPKCREDFERLY